MAFAGWMAQQESRRKSERIKAGLAGAPPRASRSAARPAAVDKKPRRRSGYVAAWETGGRHRERAADEPKSAAAEAL